MGKETGLSFSSIYHHWMAAGAPWIVLLFGLVGLYVVVVPSTTPVTSLGIYNEKRVLQVAVLGAAGFMLLASRASRRQWLSTFGTLPLLTRVGLGVVLGLGIVSAALAPAPGYAFLEVGHFVLLFAVAGSVATVVRQLPRHAGVVVLGVVVLSAFLYTVHFSVSYGVYLALPELEIGRQTISGFGNVRFLNQYQTWTLPLLAVPVVVLPRRWWAARGLVFGFLVLWWTLLFASVVRGTLVAVFVAAVVVGGLFGRRALRFIGIQVAALVVGFGLYLLLFASGGGESTAFVDQVDRTQSVVGRLDHWRICLEMAASHPFLGAGPMHYAWPPINFLPAASPHSSLMQWLGEWGVPSTLIMSGLTVWGGWQWMQQEKDGEAGTSNDSDTLRVALVASALAGAAHSLVSGLLVTPLSQVLLVLIGGWAWGRYQHKHRPTTDASWSAHAVLCTLLVGAMAVVGLRMQDLSTIEERRSAFMEEVDRGYYSPRYWGQGYLHVRDDAVMERARRKQ